MPQAETHLIIDIGNSSIKLAVFEKNKTVFQKRYIRLLASDIKELVKIYDFEWCICSSVRKTPPRFVQHLARNYHLITMDSTLPTPIVNTYSTPETLGMDRLAAVVGAHAMFPDHHCLVIDMGTCIKYDFIDKEGVYHGGNIAPGLQMRLQSMHTMTSKLPLASVQINEQPLGWSTETALQNGAIWGIKSEIEGFIKTLTDKWQDITIILTGGDANYFGEIVESKIFVLPDLVLSGLNVVLDYNKPIINT